MAHPARGRRFLQRLQALAPHREPAVADDRGVGRGRHPGEERRAVLQIIAEQTAAHVMHVVGVAIVGGAGGHDRAQRGRCEGRDLQRVEAAPGQADHADGAAAPRLAGDPGDDLDRVGPFTGRIFVPQHAIRIARAAHVDANGVVAGLCEGGMENGVIAPVPVPAPIREIFEDGGRRRRPFRPPQPRHQPTAIGQGNPDRFVNVHAGCFRYGIGRAASALPCIPYCAFYRGIAAPQPEKRGWRRD
jgi:hypothetical protein